MKFYFSVGAIKNVDILLVKFLWHHSPLVFVTLTCLGSAAISTLDYLSLFKCSPSTMHSNGRDLFLPSSIFHEVFDHYIDRIALLQ